MEKYFITDGKEYIKDTKGSRFFTTKSPVLAKEFEIKNAKKVLCNMPSGIRKDFYLEGIETFAAFTIEDLEEKEGREKRNTEYINQIEKLAENFMEMEFPSKGDLNNIKRKLEEDQSFYDRALSDVRHWIKVNNPAAHIRTKIYKIQQDLERERARVKQALLFTNKLVNAVNNNVPINQLVKEIKESQYVEYTANTYVYAVLENLK